MILGGRSLHDLSLSDFQSLIDNHIPEGPHLEYKEAAYSGRASDIREMLRDVTALANAEGGYLVMGIREDYASRAAAFSPIDDPKAKAQAITQACLDGIQERIPGLEVVSFESGFNQGIIVIRTIERAAPPHGGARSQHGFHLPLRNRQTSRGLESRELVRREILVFGAQLVELELLAQGRCNHLLPVWRLRKPAVFKS